MRIPGGKSFQNIGSKIVRSKRVVMAIVLVVLLIMPRSSKSQILPSPCCALLSVGLGSISSAISDVIGGALNAINATMSSIQMFEQTVVWPQNLINQAKAAVAAFENILNQIRRLVELPVRSATLPATQQLEQTLLSANTDQIDAMNSAYTAVYSAVPQAPDATPEVRNLIDMTDATAEAAMKRAIEIDAIVDLEMQAADQMIQQIQTAAPGSAPILEAGADVWLVRANAYTQTALTELMRLRAVDLAGQSARMKLDSGRAAKLRGNLTNSLKRN